MATINIKTSLKKLYINDGFIFEELGIDYYGPINGHDIDELELYLNLAKKATHPVLIHVITEKGKGYKFSEEDTSGKWHGVSPFNIETGEFNNSNTDLISWSEVVSETLIKYMRKDLIVITPAMAGGCKLLKLSTLFPQNFIDVGIAEEHALVLANGLSVEGKIPFVSIYSTFLQRGYDELLHDIARMNSHVIIGIDRCGIVGEDGETHQGVFDISFLLPIPNLIICQPKDSEECNNLIYTALNTKGPICIRYSKLKVKYKIKNEAFIKIGSWESISKGKDATLITYGDFITNAIKIQKSLKNIGINIEVINARFLKPIDEVMFEKILKKNKPIFVYEESMEIGSLGSYLKNISNVEIYIFGIEDKFVEQGKRDELLVDLGLDCLSVFNKIKRIILK
jgi:1-deoxy-D-xylulose-5-phosphate synthase